MTENESGTTYGFYPIVRPGLRPGADDAFTVGDVPDASSVEGGELEITAEVAGGDQTETATLDAQLFGPGDVTGLDDRTIVRMEPSPGTGAHPPTQFPLIEFGPAELPWLFSPLRADEEGRTYPWLSLIAVDRDHPDISYDPVGPASMAVLETPTDELPTLTESWAWAHAQLLGEPLDVDGDPDEDAVLAELGAPSMGTRSRLVCPRNLEAKTRYRACVVPTFEAGRLTGLDSDPADADRTFAWDDGEVRLPVYHSWTFTCADEGDFRTLANKLEPQPADDGLGTSIVDVTDPGPASLRKGAVSETDRGVVTVTGALRSPTAPQIGYEEDVATTLRSLLNRQEEVDRQIDLGVVAPSLYGRWHARADRLSEAPPDDVSDLDVPLWFDQLNGEPANRGGAGFGTKIVSELAAQLMDEAWNQFDGLAEANTMLARAQLFRDVNERRYDEITALPDGEVLGLTEAIHGHVRLDSGGTLLDRIETDPSVRGRTRPTFRNLTRSNGPVSRRDGIDVDRTPVVDPDDEIGSHRFGAGWRPGSGRFWEGVHVDDPVATKATIEDDPQFRNSGEDEWACLAEKTGDVEWVGQSEDEPDTDHDGDVDPTASFRVTRAEQQPTGGEVDGDGERSTARARRIDRESKRRSRSTQSDDERGRDESLSTLYEWASALESAAKDGDRAAIGRLLREYGDVRDRLEKLRDLDDGDDEHRRVGPTSSGRFDPTNRRSRRRSGEDSIDGRVDSVQRSFQQAHRQFRRGDVPAGLDVLERGRSTLEALADEVGGSIDGPERGDPGDDRGRFDRTPVIDDSPVFDRPIGGGSFPGIDPPGDGDDSDEPGDGDDPPGLEDGEDVLEFLDRIERAMRIADDQATEVRDATPSTEDDVRRIDQRFNATPDPVTWVHRAHEDATTLLELWPPLFHQVDESELHPEFTESETMRETRRMIDEIESLQSILPRVVKALAAGAYEQAVEMLSEVSGLVSDVCAIVDWLRDGLAMGRDKVTPDFASLDGAVDDTLAAAGDCGVLSSARIDPADAADAVRDELEPDSAFTELAARRLGIDAEQLRNRETPGERDRDGLESVLASPTITRPMYEPLAEHEPEWFLPGLGDVSRNSVTLVESNPTFIEAYMAGLNHEFARELRWNRFPTDRRGTFFRRFWDRSANPALDPDDPEDMADIAPMHEWGTTSELGENPPEGNEEGSSLVLLVRGELLERYPNTTVYATDAHEADGDDGERVPALPETEIEGSDDERDDIKFPEFQGTIGSDVAFYGFDLDPEAALHAPYHADGERADEGPDDRADEGWFFVFEEPAAEPRFGLIDPASDSDWLPAPGGHVDVDENEPDSDPEHVEGAQWGRNAAHVAKYTWLQPYRVAIHASTMLADEVSAR
ncbi:hypothetical protein [Halovivax gelatinilyticus]|uniref:hypothetical protein n=1 Tax=Halovivax gelatinilyticus TaxID=2961597 RepID=UPI0020CA4428|nr:hypothetical protein [Halovivax gelatinilyticus]